MFVNNASASPLCAALSGMPRFLPILGAIQPNMGIRHLRLENREVFGIAPTYAAFKPNQAMVFRIGGVAAVDATDGAVSPGGVGCDVNCGVRVITTGLEAEAITPHMQDIVTKLLKAVPTGRHAKLGPNSAGRH